MGQAEKDKEGAGRVVQKQLGLAVVMGLPVVIHMREAEKEMVEVIRSMDRVPRGQFHCWSGRRIF